MREPPFDLQFALAAQVLAMTDHYLEVVCGCGARRVIGLCRLAGSPRIRTMTLATVALKVKCEACFTGPDEVHLTATVHGLHPPPVTGDAVWSLLLWQHSPRGGSYHHRRLPDGNVAQR